jgi:uncharacterized protein YxeA
MKKLLKLFLYLILLIVVILFIWTAMNYEYLSCMLNGTSETIDYCRSL